MTAKFVMTCDKDSVYLSRDKANHMYLIEFKAVNANIRIDALLTFDIYKMMFELNKDLFDAYHVAYPDPADSSRAEILFIFKSVLGLGERYTHVCTYMPHLEQGYKNQPDQGQIIRIISANVPKGTESALKHLIPRRAEQIDSDDSNITIYVQPDAHAMQFHYNFKLQLSKPDDVISVPPFVDKAVSTMMKTIFVRMKQFIECLG